MAYTWPSGDILSFTSQCPHIIILTLTFISIIFLFFLQGHHRTTNKYPSRGVTNWPILGALPVIVRHKNQVYDLFTALILRGDSLTLTLRGPWFSSFGYVITCHPPNINHILNSNFPNYPNGPDFIDIFDVLGRGVLTSDGDSWASQRKMATAHLSNRGFRSLMMAAPQRKVSDVLIPLLERARGEEVDLGDLFARLSTDAACVAFLGVDPEYLSPELPDFPFANAVEIAEDVILRRHLVPKQWWKFLRWLRVGSERKMAEATVPSDRFIYQCIERKREELEARLMKLGEVVMNDESSSTTTTDLLTLYMEDLLVDKERRVLVDDPDKMRFIRDTIITMLIAGNDSSGITLAWFFWLVVKNPDVEKKILQELIQIRRRRSGSSKAAAGSNTFDEEETEGAVYLHAALLETLRLYPPFPFNHKQALKGDTLPSGHRVDAGVNVILSAYSMARMEAVWGKDCSEFKPERWIVSNGGGRLEVRHEPTYKFMSFLSGPRTCMGKNMSLSRLKWIIAAVIYNFQFQLVEGHVVEPKMAMMLRMKNGLKTKVSKRVFD